ncbi:MAG: 50S ribosomal protein L18 [Rhodothermales bacterium]|nr:50S ribosomal protein L18 [Rhodothermales bacterium]
MPKTTHQRRAAVKRGIRKKISGTSDRPRLTVFRSNKHIYAQLIDDLSGRTLAAAGSNIDGVDGKNRTEISKAVGQKLAENAKEAGIEQVVFDRNGYRYHGRVKALADGAREGGLKF